MRIGIDIDNVLSNFNEVLLRDYIEYNKKLINTGTTNKETSIRNMFDWSGEEEQQYYKDNIERIANLLEPIENCSKYIKDLREDGNVIYIISGRDNGQYSDPYNMTINWLKKYDIEYDELILTNSYNHIEKAYVCIDKSIDIMIDDSRKVCEKCLEKNIKPLIFNTDYNKKESRFKRVYNWKEIYDYIKELEEDTTKLSS